jgi:hypothetical protein
MSSNDVETLTLALLDGELDEEGVARLEALIAADDAAHRTFVRLVEQEGLLVGLGATASPERSGDVAVATMKRIRERIAESVQSGVMSTLRAGHPRTAPTTSAGAPVVPLSPWLRRRGAFAAAAAAVLLVAVPAARKTAISLEQQPEQEVTLVAEPQLTPGRTGSWRALVRNGRTEAPARNVPVHFVLTGPGGAVAWQADARTDEVGLASVSPRLREDVKQGRYRLAVRGGGTEATRAIDVKRSYGLFVSTDKPRYQPGQTLHVRALALAARDRRPAASERIALEVFDARGNKIFRRAARASAFGLVSADVPLADQLNMGEFKVRATLGDTVSERSVTVERYVLPRFRVDLETDRGYYAPGETIRGTLTARYTFGEPVAGAEVEVVALQLVEQLRPFQTVRGRTDPQGRLAFQIELPASMVGQPLRQGDALVSLEATVTDRASNAQKRTLERTIAMEPIHVDVVPESAELVRGVGVPNLIHIVTSYPDGRAAPAHVTIVETGEVVRTDEAGLGQWRWSEGQPTTVTLRAVDSAGVSSERRLSIPEAGAGSNALLLRADEAIYRAGDSVRLSVFTPRSERRVFVDVVKDRETVLTDAIDVRRGQGALVLDLPGDLTGTLAVTAYRVGNDGAIVSDTKVVQVREAQDLVIEAALDRESYRPGETATLALRALRSGQPVVAALSLSAVDEAVYALQEARPGLERVYFALQEELLKPRYEIHEREDLAPAALLESPTGGRGAGAEVTLAAARGIEGPAHAASPTWEDRSSAHRARVRAAERQTWAGAALVPSLAFLLLLAPLFAYAAARIVRRAPAGTASADDVAPARRALRRLVVTWALGIYVPLVAVALAAWVAPWSVQEELAVVVVVAVAIAWVAALVVGSRKVARCAEIQARPALRRILALLPWAFASGAVGALLAIAALDEEMALAVFLGTFGLAAIVTGALSLSGESALRALSFGAALWRGASRGALALAPLAVLAFLTLTVAKSPSLARRDRMMMAPGFVPSPSVVTQSATTNAAAPLQAAARIRSYFPETLLWRPEVVTNARGEARVEVPLADSITTWRVGIGAVSREGLLGSQTVGIRVFQPFFVEPDLPVALTQHDAVELRVAVYNYLDTPQRVRIDLAPASWYSTRARPVRELALAPREITRVSFPITAERAGVHTLTVRASGSEMGDAVERQVRVEPDGDAVTDTRNGELRGRVALDVTFPAAAIEGASSLVLKIYPGAFSQVVEGLDGILQMPSGCFEQTSSSTYPNVLVLDYMRRTRQSRPAVEMRALEFIRVGYQRLLSYEVAGGGFEWFGESPAHPVLTAYGLLEFHDMGRVTDVDPAVIERTRDWLFSQQKPDGSWEPTERGIAEGAINAYQGKTLRTTAYVAWALGASGERDPRIARALEYVDSGAGDERDPYTLALVAHAYLANDRGPQALAVLRRLDSMKQEEGSLVHWTSESEGVTSSLGAALDVETTALAADAYQRARYGIATAHRALAWLVSKKDRRGTWESTQATIAAMRALLAGAAGGGDVEGRVEVLVRANGADVERVAITNDDADVFRTLDLTRLVRTGANRVELAVEGRGNLAYQLVATHYVPRPPGGGGGDGAEEPLSIEVAYDTTTLATGDLLTARVALRYNRPGVARMTLVDLAIPPGFELRTGAFEELQEGGTIERFTVTDRQVILYFRELQGGRPVTFSYSLRAQYPLRVTARRSVAYQYYEPDVRDESDAVALRVR